MLEAKQQTFKLIQKVKNILVIPPDPINGDALGGSLALIGVLQKLGKNARLVLSPEIPDKFNFLFKKAELLTGGVSFPKINSLSPDELGEREFILSIGDIDENIPEPRFGIKNNRLEIHLTSKKKIEENNIRLHPAPFLYEAIFTIASQDFENLGQVFEKNPELFFETPIINIDNQPSNENFGEINLIDLTSSSTTEIVMDLIEYLNRDLLDEDIATALLTGIISATNNFQSSKTCPKTFNNAAFLINKGASQQKIIRYLYKARPLNFLRLWGGVLRKLRWDEKRKIISTIIKDIDFKRTSTSPDCLPRILEELKENFPQIKTSLILWESPIPRKEIEQEIKLATTQMPLQKDINGLIYSSASGFFRSLISKLEAEQIETSLKNGNLFLEIKDTSLEEAEKQILDLLDRVL